MGDPAKSWQAAKASGYQAIDCSLCEDRVQSNGFAVLIPPTAVPYSMYGLRCWCKLLQIQEISTVPIDQVLEIFIANLIACMSVKPHPNVSHSRNDGALVKKSVDKSGKRCVATRQK